MFINNKKGGRKYINVEKRRVIKLFQYIHLTTYFAALKLLQRQNNKTGKCLGYNVIC